MLQIKHVKIILDDIEKLTSQDGIFKKTQEAIRELEKILNDIRPNTGHDQVITNYDPWDPQ